MVRKDITTMKDLPFTNTYHQLEMDVDMIEWTLKDTVMTMEMLGAKQQVPAYFNSMLSYNEADYIRLKGAFPFHPLQVITNYCNKNKTKEFSASALADATKQKQNTIESSLSFLQKKGFVVFNQNSSTYSLTEKAKLYQFARQEKKDYDVIFIKSVAVTKPADPSKEPIKALPYNGSLNLNDNKLTVAGVDKVVLSDSNDVFFEPKERKIVFTKNRNIVFDGTLKTNNYIFNGREFEFNYEKFNLKLEHIDSIEFTIEVYDSVTKTMKREKMDNKLSYSKGTLSIDEPTNKSGIKRNPRYPHFDANHGASVLFSNADILNGVYDSTFRYLIPPFAVDSLSGDMESNVSFDGEFVSGGVFPPIPQKLEVMNDRGFGFNHKVPEEGYPIYGGLGRFYGKIAMSKSGLRGEGKIVFLNTTLESLDFVFYRDSVKGLGDIAITKPGTNPKTGSDIKFPACTVTDYEMSWYPSLDSMHITNYDNAFKLFNDEVDLSGALIITSKGMKGTGLVETNGSLTISKNFLFKETSLGATKAQFEILTNIVGKPALKSDYVNIDIDLAKKQAFFSPTEEGYASNNFPYLKYKTSLNDGFWDMEKKIVTMEKPYEMDLKDSYFYSTKKSQDSLVFNAEKAYYYIDSLTLKIEGVEQIKIADAMVYPENKKIEIKENAKITTLKNAVIIMDTLNEYHTLIHGEIDINSRNDLDGHASYRYVNFEEDTIPIKFSDFKLEAIKTESGLVEYHTIARGVVEESDTFMVAPQMIFKGDVVMYAHRRLLSIDGYIKLDLHGKVKSNNWMRYKNASDSDVILIDLESQENKNDLKLITGVFYDANAQDYYALFIGDKKSEGDLALFSASGYLTHDAEKREFEVIDKVRLDSKSYIGNLFGYIEKEEIYKQEGKFTIINQAPTLPHHYQLLFGGAGQNVIADSSLILKGLANLNFETIPQVYEQIGIKFKEMLKYLPPAKTIRLSDTLYHAIGDLAGQKEALKYKETCSKEYVALNKVVKLFDLGLTFNDLSLEWDASRKTWHSKGPIGLVSVGGQDINTFVKGYLEIIKTSEEDHVNFYLEANPDLWYYFKYSENSLRIYTSDAQLTTLIQSKNTESKNMSKGLYYWASAEEEDATRFKQHFVQDFLNGKDLEIDYTSIASSESEDEFEVKDEKKDVKDEFEEELDTNEPKKESTKPKNKEEIEKTKETVNDSDQLEETTKEVDDFEETVKNVQKEKAVEENTTRPESKESEIKTKKEEIKSKKSKDKKSKEKSNKEPEKEQDIEKNTGDVDEFEQ